MRGWRGKKRKKCRHAEGGGGGGGVSLRGRAAFWQQVVVNKRV